MCSLKQSHRLTAHKLCWPCPSPHPPPLTPWEFLCAHLHRNTHLSRDWVNATMQECDCLWLGKRNPPFHPDPAAWTPSQIGDSPRGQDRSPNRTHIKWVIKKHFLKKMLFKKHGYILLRFYLFTFRERGREGEKHRCEKHQWTASHTPPTGDPAHNPGMCPDWELNQ